MKFRGSTFLLVIIGAALLIVVGIQLSLCTGNDQARGFSLPPGDPKAGEEAFAALNCQQCHTVYESERFKDLPENAALHVALGGETRVVKTYGELVTAIVHPMESIRPEYREKFVDSEGRTLMPDLTQTMTTRQLIDLIAYLQDHYELIAPQIPENYYPYGYYPMP